MEAVSILALIYCFSLQQMETEMVLTESNSRLEWVRE